MYQCQDFLTVNRSKGGFKMLTRVYVCVCDKCQTSPVDDVVFLLPLAVDVVICSRGCCCCISFTVGVNVVVSLSSIADVVGVISFLNVYAVVVFISALPADIVFVSF